MNFINDAHTGVRDAARKGLIRLSSPKAIPFLPIVIREQGNEGALGKAAVEMALQGGNPDPNALLPQQVEVDLAEGRTVAFPVSSVLGSPERPLSPEAAHAKFTACWASAPDLPAEQGEALWDAVFRLEALDDVRPLAKLSGQ